MAGRPANDHGFGVAPPQDDTEFAPAALAPDEGDGGQQRPRVAASRQTRPPSKNSALRQTKGAESGPIFARKGEAAPLVDKKGGAEAPEEVVAQSVAKKRARALREDAANPSIINERSAEAGYEPNPTPEEVDQIEAERAAFIRRPARPSAIVETIDSETDAEVDAPGAFEPTDDIAVSSGPAEFGDAELLDVSAPPPARRVRPTAAAEQAMPLRLSLPASDMLRLKLATAILRSDETTIVREALSAYFDQNGVDRFDPS